MVQPEVAFAGVGWQVSCRGDQTCGICVAAVGTMTFPAFDHRVPDIGWMATVVDLSAARGKRPGVLNSAKGSNEAHGPDSRPECAPRRRRRQRAPGASR